jgi:hypothetical protein
MKIRHLCSGQEYIAEVYWPLDTAEGPQIAVIGIAGRIDPVGFEVIEASQRELRDLPERWQELVRVDVPSE